MTKKMRRGEFDASFANASLEEMAQRVKQYEAQTDRRNYVIILSFFLLLSISIAIGLYFYGHWVLETVQAAGGVVWSMWHLEWWQALAIFFEYKLSFLLLGIVVGFVLFLFITLRIGELIVDTIWDTIHSVFN